MWHNAKLLNLIANLLFAAAVLVLVGGVLRWIAQRPMFVLREIDVVGQSGQPLRHVNLPSIRASALLQERQLHGSFFNVNLEKMRVAFEAVPWVRHASVRRIWPNRLQVQVEEHQALAAWPDGRLVNSFGELFVANPAEAEEDGDLREFSGPQDQADAAMQVTQRYRQLQQWLAPLQRTVQTLSLSERNGWHVVLDDGMQMELGRESRESPNAQAGESIQARVLRYVAAAPEVTRTLAKKIDSVDLRYPNGFAIRAAGLRVMNQLEARMTVTTGRGRKQ
ncbi:MAG: FtsQ-type POTRA domain-containing protein [Burkholderiaceae bacterium]|nr:MAG: FtsQ-type POTRA domain-containing protein [Burkholderiaceae bacterium]